MGVGSIKSITWRVGVSSAGDKDLSGFCSNEREIREGRWLKVP